MAQKWLQSKWMTNKREERGECVLLCVAGWLLSVSGTFVMLSPPEDKKEGEQTRSGYAVRPDRLWVIP